MQKKYYLILSSYYVDDEIRAKASTYYGSKDYECVYDNPDNVNVIKKSLENETVTDSNAELLLIGTTIIGMSLCDSIYVAKDWEQSDYCKVCHALAFSHGLEIVYES